MLLSGMREYCHINMHRQSILLDQALQMYGIKLNKVQTLPVYNNCNNI